MSKILIAPHKENISGPLVFLSGPVHGAPDWHSDAIGLLSINRDLNIASPRRVGNGILNESDYAEQISWERLYQDYAFKKGVMLFWFPKPLGDSTEQAYAQTACFELGEAIALNNFQKIRLVVGIENDFSDENYLRKTIVEKVPDIYISNTLGEACEKVLALISPYE